MPIDTSIYGNIQPIDPLGQLQKMAATSQAVTGARSAQVDLQGKVALGQHIQSAIDPTTGQVDTNKLVAGLKSDPAAFAAAGAGTDMALSQRGAQLTNQTTGLNLNQAAFSNLGTAWAAQLAQNPGPISSDQLAKTATQLLVEGRITPDVFKGVMRTMPPEGEDARAYAAGGYISSLPNTLTAGVYPASPGPDGAPRQQTGAQFLAQTTGTEGAPAATGAPIALGAPPAAGGAPPAASGGPLTTGLGPGAQSAIATAGEASANMGVNWISQANNVPDMKAMLSNMEADANEFTSGPVSDSVKKLTATANELLGTKINLDGVAAQERFNKMALQIAQSQAGALGITDQREQTAMGANPNSTMSNLGIHGVISLLKGNQDAIAARAQAWQKYLNSGGTPDQAGAWANSPAGFNSNYDPRVFQSVYLDPADRKKLAASMSKDEVTAFRKKYNYAVQNGWIAAPTAGGTSAQ